MTVRLPGALRAPASWVGSSLLARPFAAVAAVTPAAIAPAAVAAVVLVAATARAEPPVAASPAAVAPPPAAASSAPSLLPATAGASVDAAPDAAPAASARPDAVRSESVSPAGPAGPAGPPDLVAADDPLGELPPPSSGLGELAGPLVKTMLMLGVVLLFAYLTLHKGLGKLVERQNVGRRVKVVERVALDQRRSLFLVDVDGKQMLLAAGEGGVVHLRDVDAPAPPQQDDRSGQPLSRRFAEALKSRAGAAAPVTGAIRSPSSPLSASPLAASPLSAASSVSSSSIEPPRTKA